MVVRVTSRSVWVGAAALAVSIGLAGCFGASDGIDVPGATVPAPSTTEHDAVTTSAVPPATEPAATTPTVTTDPAPSTAPPTTPAPAVTEPPPPTPPPTVEDPFLRIGDEGDEVALMQLKLRTLDYLAPGYAEGVFDRPTADALIDFQAQYGLVVDGVFGPETDRSLSAAAASVNPEA